MALTITTAARNAACDAIVDLLDADASAAVLVFRTSGDTEVATLTMSDPAFGAASTGTATAGSITSDTNATGGTIAKFTLEDGANTEVIEGTVTATSGGGDIELSSLTIGAGDTVSVSSLTITMPAS